MTDVIASPDFLAFFNTEKGTPIIGAINSTFSGGAVFGSLMGGLTMDRFGRRKTIMIGAIISLIGSILQAAAQNLAMILVGRIIAGWAVGLLSMAVPVYQSECAHPKIRGLIVGLAQQMIGVGFIVYVLSVVALPIQVLTGLQVNLGRLWVSPCRGVAESIPVEVSSGVSSRPGPPPRLRHHVLPRVSKAPDGD